MSTQINRPVSITTSTHSLPVSTPHEPSGQTSPPIQSPPPSSLEQRKLSFSQKTLLKPSEPPSPLPSQQEMNSQIEQIDKITPQKMLENLKAMPRISSLTPLPKDTFREKLSQLVTQNLVDSEKSLRSTFFKSHQSIRGELNKANRDVRQALQQDPQSQQLLQHFRSISQRDAKDFLAQSISGMRAEKYGAGVNYIQLSKNKQALVDAVYNGIMGADLEPTGKLTVPEDKKGPVGKLGFGATLKQDLTVTTLNGSVYEMKAGQPVTVHQQDGKTFIQPSKLKADATDPTAFDAYEVSASQVEIKDPGILKIKPQTFTPITEPLFANPISVTDIRQGAIGDCYLIAGIYAIARKNPDAIYNMMKDNGDGTVTVKFHGTLPGTTKFGEIYITVDKSVPNDDAHVDGAPWVQMLEKAYATYKGSYDAIGRGGKSSDVFETFLGSNVHSPDILAASPNLEKLANRIGGVGGGGDFQSKLKAKQEEWGLSDTQVEQLCSLPPDQLRDFKFTAQNVWKWPQFTEKANAFKQLPKDAPPEVRKQAADERQEETLRLKALNEKVFALVDRDDRDQALREMLQSHPQHLQSSLNPEGLSKQEFEQVISDLREKAKIQPETTVKDKKFPTAELVDELEAMGKDQFPDRSKGTTGYTDAQNELFNKMGTLLKEGEYLAVGTKKEIGVSQGKGHSGGESVVDGLAGQHAYAVLDVFEQNGLKFVRVANPWGNDFSRDYEMREGKLVAKQFKAKDYSYLPNTENKGGAGIGVNESWIELRELAQLFSSLYHTKT